MLKGVNKSVIEINCTDHGYFEKAILFVKPEQSGISQKRLKGEAEKYINLIDADMGHIRAERTVRISSASLKKYRTKMLIILTTCIAALGVFIYALFNIL